RGVDAGDLLGADAPGELLGQDARAAPDVEHALPGLDAGEVGEHGRKTARVAAHEAVVGITRDGEAHPRYSRWRGAPRQPPPVSRRARRALRAARAGPPGGAVRAPARRC